MFSYKVVIQYDGRDYHGWQKQTKQSIPTIQGVLESSISQAFKCSEIKSLASGRTDAGVHALGQVLRIDIPFEIPVANFTKAINDLLPDSIKILSAQKSSLDFSPQKDAIDKEYRYYFSVNPDKPLSFVQQRYTHTLSGGYDLSKMRQACKLLIGSYDFSHYYCEGTPAKSFVRDIYDCEILETPHFSPMIQTSYCFRIRGNGFLKQMVRLIVGAVWSMGQDRLSLETFEQSLKNPEEIEQRHLAALAPANGLMLYRVAY